MLPGLYRAGFRGRVYATHATYDLCALMLMDSAHIQENDAEFYNKRFRKKGEPAVEPLYTKDDAEGVLDLFVGVGYRAPFEPVAGCEVEYRDAGHILGSATMTLTVTEGGRQKRLGFTGDVGNPGRPILRDPQPMLAVRLADLGVDVRREDARAGGQGEGRARRRRQPDGGARRQGHHPRLRRRADAGARLRPRPAVERGADSAHPRLRRQPARGQRHRRLPDAPRVLRPRRSSTTS